MRAFIVRPFGVKNDIDFDAVEEKLIGPALDKLGVTGRTTGEIVGQGNIRTDMFQLLLTADLVVADLSIHNANVFYELGIRHALRDRHTFLLRCNVDKYPFDLQTDRYFTYNKDAPADSVDQLADALRATIDEGKTNSPVFASLPNMREQDPSQFMAVPLGFSEEVDRAVADRQFGDLGRQFTYARYNAELSTKWLKKRGLEDIDPAKVSQLDSVAHIPDLIRVGQALAKEVQIEHFCLDRFNQFY